MPRSPLLQQLHDRLFILWGDLEERKVAFFQSHPTVQPDEQFSALAHGIKASNLPFDACVEEVGLPDQTLGLPPGTLGLGRTGHGYKRKRAPDEEDDCEFEAQAELDRLNETQKTRLEEMQMRDPGMGWKRSWRLFGTLIR